jgi:hypothetical protein
MSELWDMEGIYRQERERWLREEAPHKSLRDRLADSVPYWIIMVALVLYGLSAPHTAGVFDKLTPGWGWIAPIGVEFGLLYAAFRRRLAHAAEEALPWTLWALEILLFLTAMLVNGAGAFASVIAAVQLESLSFAAIAETSGHLPATSQAALMMAGLSAFIVPIGALVAGEGLAALALERNAQADPNEGMWQAVEFKVIYRAIYVRYLQQGITERDARQRAFSEVRGYLGKGSAQVSSIRQLSTPNGQNGQESEQQTNGHSGRNGHIKAVVHTYLDANPGLDQLSVNQVLAQLKMASVKAGCTTVAEALQERRGISVT